MAHAPFRAASRLTFVPVALCLPIFSLADTVEVGFPIRWARYSGLGLGAMKEIRMGFAPGFTFISLQTN